MSLLARLMKAREISIVLLMILFIVLVGLINPDFISRSSLSLLVNSSMILLILAIGQSFVLMTADIDVSVGSTMGLSAAVGGTLLVGGLPWIIVFIATLAVGFIAGLLNGVGVAKFKIPAIIMTLGMLGVVRGVMLIYTGGKWIQDIPDSFIRLSELDWLGVSLPVWIGLILIVGAHFVLTRTNFGRHFFALGDNVQGAKLVGIPIVRIKVLAFIFSGLSASIAALIFIMNIGNVPNNTGEGKELIVIAAAVLGGVSLTGGQGSVIGAGLGAIFITLIDSSLVYLKIPAYWNSAISGFLLLIIVVGDVKFQSYLRKNNARINKRKKINLSLSESQQIEKGRKSDENQDQAIH